MAKRRGFFAEMNHQAQQSDKRRRQQKAAASRAAASAERTAQQAQKRAEQAAAAATRASAAEQRAAEKEAARLHVEARLAEVSAMNAQLAARLEDVDSILSFTLDLDDYVDLETLKLPPADQPTFEAGDLAVPVDPMPELVYPPAPEPQEPKAPSGLAGALGGKKRYQDAVARAHTEHERAVQDWQTRCQTLYTDYLAEQQRRQIAEADRVEKLAQAKSAFDEERTKREAEVQSHNDDVTRLTTNLAFDVPEAIEEYVDIVLSNSVYPDVFPVGHQHSFDLASRELNLAVTVPDPSVIPTVKEYRYIKAKDEITSSSLTMKAQKDRYANAVWQVAVRSLHQVFEADRAGKIHSIALTVSADRISPATGLPEQIPLVVVAADRQTFQAFDLANVVPQATLTHLGAAMSTNPADLALADTGPGVRRHR